MKEVHGTGRFGEAKAGHTSWYAPDTDLPPLQSALWDQKIFVDVVSYDIKTRIVVVRGRPPHTTRAAKFIKGLGYKMEIKSP